MIHAFLGEFNGLALLGIVTVSSRKKEETQNKDYSNILFGEQSMVVVCHLMLLSLWVGS